MGAAFRVHAAPDQGFQELIDERAMLPESRRLPLETNREFEMPVYCFEERTGARRVDFIFMNQTRFKLKVTGKVDTEDMVQTTNYLEVYIPETGMLVNLCSKKTEYHHLTSKTFAPHINN